MVGEPENFLLQKMPVFIYLFICLFLARREVLLQSCLRQAAKAEPAGASGWPPRLPNRDVSCACLLLMQSKESSARGGGGGGRGGPWKEFVCRRHDKTEHQAFWSRPGPGASPAGLAGRGGSPENESRAGLQHSPCYQQLPGPGLFPLTFSLPLELGLKISSRTSSLQLYLNNHSSGLAVCTGHCEEASWPVRRSACSL